MENSAIWLIIGIALSAIGFFIYDKYRKDGNKETSDELMSLMEMKIKSMLPEVLKDANSQLIQVANDKLGSEKREIQKDVETKRSEIERMVRRIERDLKDNQLKLEETEKQRVGSFENLSQRLNEYKDVTDKLSSSTEKLNKVLASNQGRGKFGEQVAEDLLKMSGFVIGTDFVANKAQASNSKRPDFTVFLPDGTKINVDVKFPLNNLQAMTQTEDRGEKERLFELFRKDVKEKIKQVTTRDYINPDENTVDFVIIFIPNESIFSIIYERMQDVWQYAIEQKVVLAGPFSFTAILRMVRQSYDYFKVSQNIRSIANNIESVSKEFGKFSESFEKVGKKLDAVQKEYDTVRTTRFNQLRKKMDSVKSIDEIPKSSSEPSSLPTLNVAKPTNGQAILSEGNENQADFDQMSL